MQVAKVCESKGFLVKESYDRRTKCLCRSEEQGRDLSAMIGMWPSSAKDRDTWNTSFCANGETALGPLVRQNPPIGRIPVEVASSPNQG